MSCSSSFVSASEVRKINLVEVLQEELEEALVDAGVGGDGEGCVVTPSDEALKEMSEDDIRMYFQEKRREALGEKIAKDEEEVMKKASKEEERRQESEEEMAGVGQREGCSNSVEKRRNYKCEAVSFPQNNHSQSSHNRGSGNVVSESLRASAQCHEQSGRYVAACELYSNAIATTSSQDVRPLEWRASLLLQHGPAFQLNFLRSIYTATKSSSTNCSSSAAEIALLDAEASYRLRPRRSQALTLKGEALLQLGNYEGAKDAFNEVIRRRKKGGGENFIVDNETFMRAEHGSEKAKRMIDKTTRSATNVTTKSENLAYRKNSSRQATSNDSRWNGEKELGNSAFREKRFQDAVKHYDRAIDYSSRYSTAQASSQFVADEELASLFSNRSAAYLSLALSIPQTTPVRSSKNNNKSISKYSSENNALNSLSLRGSYIALARGDALHATRCRPQWSKAYSRLGVACLHLADDDDDNMTTMLDEAENAFKKGMELSRPNPDPDPTWSACDEGMREVLQRKKSLENKKNADAAYRRGDYHDAIDFYTLALRALKSKQKENKIANPRDAILLSNRAACYLHLHKFELALSDAHSAVNILPLWYKPYLRAANVLCELKKPEQAYLELTTGIGQCQAQQRMTASNNSDSGVAELVQMRLTALQELMSYASKSPMTQTRLSSDRETRWLRRDSSFPCSKTRIFATSDLHVDQHGNISWVQNIDNEKFRDDVVIVAGDVGDTFQAVRAALSSLVRKFRRVFFVPGNHEMWIRPDTKDGQMFPDSICKLLKLQALCDELGVDIGPAEVCSGVFVVPLYSWYTHLFDTYDPNPGRLRYDKFCKWPMRDDEVHTYFLQMNRRRVYGIQYNAKGDDNIVISCSHFLPRTELPCPPVQELIKNVGDTGLDEQIQYIQSDVHVYGHTHINADGPCNYQSNAHKSKTKDNCRYVQSALEGGARDLYCIYNKGHLSGMNISCQ